MRLRRRAGRVGAVGEFCFDGRCRSSLSLNLGVAAASHDLDAVPVYGLASFLVNVSPLVSLLAEPEVFGAAATDTFSGSGAVFGFGYGVRIASAARCRRAR